ncbi:MAG: glycosyltransferase family 9 protein [Magnetococcales bacterium]|nr:glycosyltransferase family 9 protein [Magnetococcales bacterium]
MDRNKKSQIFSCNNFAEVVAVERSSERLGVTVRVAKMLIVIWLYFINTILKALTKLLFSSSQPTNKDIKHLTIYTVGTMGDSIVKLPVIAALKKQFSDARFTVVINCDGYSPDLGREVFQSSTTPIDRFIILPKSPVSRHGFAFKIDFPTKAEYRCDLFVNLSPFGNRGLIGSVAKEMILAKKLAAKWATGFHLSSYNRRGIFNNIQHHFVQNEPRRANRVLQQLGITPLENTDPFKHDEKAKQMVEEKLSKLFKKELNKPLIILVPGSKFLSCRWPEDYYAAVAIGLTKELKANVVTVGNSEEKQLCQGVISGCGGAGGNLAGELTFQELVELMRLSSGCVSNDTGPFHAASSLDIPTIAVANTRHSPTVFFPIAKHTTMLFCFDDNSYNYMDSVKSPSDLKRITPGYVQDILRDMFSVNYQNLK